ncbi:hypothetical protein D3C87_262320 [compost metagenome]
MGEVEEIFSTRVSSVKESDSVLLKSRRYSNIFVSHFQGKKTVLVAPTVEEMIDKLKGLENKVEEVIDYKGYKIPIELVDHGLKPKPFLVRVLNFLSKKSMPYTRYFEYFREVAIHKNPKQLEYRNSVTYYPQLKQYMTILEDKNTRQLVGYRVNDEEKYNELRKKLILGL